jgi:outer membrane protein OmpA-like peptidoglycan-associated protein
MKTQLALLISSAMLLAACATSTPERPGHFLSHNETIARCGVANYTFRHITDCTGAPAIAAKVEKAVVESSVTAAPEPSLRKQIYFGVGSAKVAATHSADITSAVDAMKANPAARVEVQGFADGSGDAEKNQALSKRRAKAVQLAIIAQGIDASRIELVKPAQAVGEQTADTTKKANDRRVEIRVY